MKRFVVLLLLVGISLVFFIEVSQRRVNAEEDVVGQINQILENQKEIIKRIDDLDQKLDVIKMRIKI